MPHAGSTLNWQSPVSVYNSRGNGSMIAVYHKSPHPCTAVSNSESELSLDSKKKETKISFFLLRSVFRYAKVDRNVHFHRIRFRLILVKILSLISGMILWFDCGYYLWIPNRWKRRRKYIPWSGGGWWLLCFVIVVNWTNNVTVTVTVTVTVAVAVLVDGDCGRWRS